MKLHEQIERKLAQKIKKNKPWDVVKNSHKKDKQFKHREERRRARRDPEGKDTYRTYKGWEF